MGAGGEGCWRCGFGASSADGRRSSSAASASRFARRCRSTSTRRRRTWRIVYVQNPTGGVFAGDRLELAVTAESGARLHLTTQSATKLYRSEGEQARQLVQFTLAPGAYVEHVPDSLIPQGGSRFLQRVLVDLDETATFVGAETIAPGRRAFGERFAYEFLELSTEVRCGGRELFVERLRFEPRRARPDRGGALGAQRLPRHRRRACAGV